MDKTAWKWRGWQVLSREGQEEMGRYDGHGGRNDQDRG